jgi:hypothetical protein
VENNSLDSGSSLSGFGILEYAADPFFLLKQLMQLACAGISFGSSSVMLPVSSVVSSGSFGDATTSMAWDSFGERFPQQLLKQLLGQHDDLQQLLEQHAAFPSAAGVFSWPSSAAFLTGAGKLSNGLAPSPISALTTCKCL